MGAGAALMPGGPGTETGRVPPFGSGGIERGGAPPLGGAGTLRRDGGGGGMLPPERLGS
jgi:hypothetical protein